MSLSERARGLHPPFCRKRRCQGAPEVDQVLLFAAQTLTAGRQRGYQDSGNSCPGHRVAVGASTTTIQLRRREGGERKEIWNRFTRASPLASEREGPGRPLPKTKRFSSRARRAPGP